MQRQDGTGRELEWIKKANEIYILATTEILKGIQKFENKQKRLINTIVLSRVGNGWCFASNEHETTVSSWMVFWSVYTQLYTFINIHRLHTFNGVPTAVTTSQVTLCVVLKGVAQGRNLGHFFASDYPLGKCTKQLYFW